MTNSNGIGISAHQMWIGRGSPAAFSRRPSVPRREAIVSVRSVSGRPRAYSRRQAQAPDLASTYALAAAGALGFTRHNRRPAEG